MNKLGHVQLNVPSFSSLHIPLFWHGRPSHGVTIQIIRKRREK